MDSVNCGIRHSKHKLSAAFEVFETVDTHLFVFIKNFKNFFDAPDREINL